MQLPLKQLAYVSSLTHEGKVVIFATVEASATDPDSGADFPFGKIYYTVRQDGFEDNTDRTAMVGWKYWTLLPFIDERPDISVREKEKEDNDQIRSHYRKSGSIGAVSQVQVVSHREMIYVFRIHRETGNVLVDRFILNGLTNELMPKLEIRYKRSRRKHSPNAKMKIVNGRLTGVDSLDFRDANDRPFSEPTKELSFLPRFGDGQFAVVAVPTADADTDRWHFFLPAVDDNGQSFIRAAAVRSDRHGEFQLDDQLIVEPAKDENARPLVRSLDAITERHFIIIDGDHLAAGLAARVYNLQTEQATQGGTQLLKGATRLLLVYNTKGGRTASLSFGLSTDGLLSLIDPQADDQEALRPPKKKEVLLPIRHLEEVRALGRVDPLPHGRVRGLSRGDGDQTVVHTDTAHGLGRFDRVELDGKKNFNGHYIVTKLSDNQFSLEQNWEEAELGNWQLLPEDPEKGLAFEGLITNIEQDGNQIKFTTALNHGLENDLEVLIKNHRSLAGEFEIEPIEDDDRSFLIATDWEPVQVINLFVEAARRKGFVFDGDGDAAQVEDILLDLPQQDAAFGHTFSCWVKPDAAGFKREQVLIAEAGGVFTLSLRKGRPQIHLRLPEGHYKLTDPAELPIESWTNLAVVIERPRPYDPVELKLFRNAAQVPATAIRSDAPELAFATLTDQGLQLKKGGGYAQFVFTNEQSPPSADFTIEAWLRPSTVSENRPIWQTSMSHWQSGDAFHALSQRHGGQLKAHISLLDEDKQPFWAEAESEMDLQKDEWNHVALVGRFGEDGNSVQFIINGRAEAPIAVKNGHPVWTEALNVLGRSEPESGPFRDRVRHYEGEIGQFRIWSYPLEVKELFRLAQVPVPSDTKGLQFDFIQWPKRAGNLSHEGGGWPAPGEILYFGEVSTCGSPIQDYSITGKTASKAYLTYQIPRWTGQFHLGGLAPLAALRITEKSAYTSIQGRPWPVPSGNGSFTMTTWVRTETGGLIWSVEEPDKGSPQYLALHKNQLLLSMRAQDGPQMVDVPELFDNEWHLLSIRFDRSFTQSDDAVAQIFIDGQSPALCLAGTRQLDKQATFKLGGQLPAGLFPESDSTPPSSRIELAHLRFWSYLRTDKQIAAALHHLPNGGEAGLAVYWPLSDDKLLDLSPQQFGLSSETHPEIIHSPHPGLSYQGGLSGVLAEVRIWNTALSAEYQKSTLFVPLVGQEFRLAGNWRMGTIWEQDRRFTDFSSFGNDGLVFGNVYISPDSLRRRLGPTDTEPLANKYRNDDLVAVSARAVYEESLEFRMLDADRKPIIGRGKPVQPFRFELRGKTGRSSREWIGADVFDPQVVRRGPVESVDRQMGWYRTSCKFVVPDGVALFRVFGLEEIEGNWHWLEIRRHRLTHISDAISRVVYKDSMRLPTIGQKPTDTHDSRVKIRRFNSQIKSYRERLAILEKWIYKAENEGKNLAQQITEVEQALVDIGKALDDKRSVWEDLHTQDQVLLSYKFRIKVKHSGKYLSINKNFIPWQSYVLPYDMVKQQTPDSDHHFDWKLEAHGNQGFYLNLAGTDVYLATAPVGSPFISFIGAPLFVKKGKEKFSTARPNSFLTISESATLIFQAVHPNTTETWDQKLISLSAIKNSAGEGYLIRVKETSMVLEIGEGKTANGALARQWLYNPPSNADNQLFHLELQEGSSDLHKVRLAKLGIDIQTHNLEITGAAHAALLAEQGGEDAVQKWKKEKSRLQTKIARAYAEIDFAQEAYMASIEPPANNNQDSSTHILPELAANDPNDLNTKGAYLNFVQASDQLSLLENCEGMVQLSYGDRFGRLRQSAYDVTADSRNPYFEEWLPDGPKPALEIRQENHLSPVTPFQLGAEYSIEWWMNCPLGSVAKEATTTKSSLSIISTEEGLILPIVGNRPMLNDDQLRGIGIPLFPDREGLHFSLVEDRSAAREVAMGSITDLSEGWHHFGLIKSGTGKQTLVELYVDGELRFNSRDFIDKVVKYEESLADVEVESANDSAKNELEEILKKLEEDLSKNFQLFDTAGQQNVSKIGRCSALNGAPQLAELRIWNLALDPEEMAANSKVELSGQEPGLLAYYKMNEGSGNEVRNFAHTGPDYNLELDGQAHWVHFDPTIGGLNRRVTFFPGSRLNIKSTNDENTESIPQTVSPRAYVRLQVAAADPRPYPIGRISFWCKLDHRMGDSSLVSFHRDDDSLTFALTVDHTGSIFLENTGSRKILPSREPFPFGSWVHLTLNQTDHEGLEIYLDGRSVYTTTNFRLPQVVSSIGSRQKNFRLEFGGKRGEMAQFAIYDRPASADWIQRNFRDNIQTESEVNGRPAGLTAYFPFDQKPDKNGRLENLVDPSRPMTFGSNYHIRLHRAIDLPLAIKNVLTNEYHTVAIDPQTQEKQAMLRRFYAMPDADGLQLFANKRVEDLELLWIGNAQFKPTLLGYIEGAPPVPSENMTKDWMLERYGGATSVALRTQEDTVYSWQRSEDDSSGYNFGLFLGAAGDVAFNVPFVGRIKLGRVNAGVQGGIDSAIHALNETSVRSSSSNITTDMLSLSGGSEEEAKFPHLGRRYVPKNVGYALVVSGLADVFVLRLRRSKRMVAYQVQANEDLPMDINTITFLINPAYTMNGSLDGMTGTQATSQRYFKQVPGMRAQYGSLYPASYFRLHEAYDLKRQIDQEDKRRFAYFENFNSRQVDEASLDDSIDNEEFDAGTINVNSDINRPTTDAEGNELSQNEQIEAASEDQEQMEKDLKDKSDQVEKSVEKRQKEIDRALDNQDSKANASHQLARWQRKMEDLQIRAGKRNIVNTYVWDADGGLRAESQQFSNTVEHTIGGSVETKYKIGGTIGTEIAFFKVQLDAMAKFGLKQTLTKTSTNSKGFALDVDISGVESSGITDHDDNPLMPGEKVDRYRFMSYYLEGTTKHFHDFFNQVVDPEWLQSNDEEARALRQTQAGKANKTWRILHRVTYVSRPALKGFGKDTRELRQIPQPKTDPLEELKAQVKEILKKLSDGDT